MMTDLALSQKLFHPQFLRFCEINSSLQVMNIKHLVQLSQKILGWSLYHPFLGGIWGWN